MTNYLDNISPSSYRSKFNPAIGLHHDFILPFNKYFLHPIFLSFCTELKINPEDLDFLPMDDIITEKEFDNSQNTELIKPYFYDVIFKAICKNPKGDVLNKVKFTFTYDLDLAPFRAGSRRYGTICLGNAPVLYYVHVDIQRALSFLKRLE